MFVCCLFRFQSQQFTLYELVKLPLNFLYGDRQRNATHNVNFAVNSHFFSYIVLSCHKSGRILCDFHIDVRAVLFSTISSRRAVDADRSPSEMSGLERQAYRSGLWYLSPKLICNLHSRLSDRMSWHFLALLIEKIILRLICTFLRNISRIYTLRLKKKSRFDTRNGRFQPQSTGPVLILSQQHCNRPIAWPGQVAGLVAYVDVPLYMCPSLTDLPGRPVASIIVLLILSDLITIDQYMDRKLFYLQNT